MFNSNRRAFFGLADSFPLGKIETKEYIPWIKGLFTANGMKLPDELIEEIVLRFENHPMYIQYFLFHLWEKKNVKELTYELIDRIDSEIIAKKNIEYGTLWETLTTNQKKTLRLILLNKGKNLYDADALKAVSLKTGSSVTKTLTSLIQKEIIVKNGNYVIQDIGFKKWLERTYSLVT
jgi:hypothetical protein